MQETEFIIVREGPRNSADVADFSLKERIGWQEAFNLGDNVLPELYCQSLCRRLVPIEIPRSIWILPSNQAQGGASIPPIGLSALLAVCSKAIMKYHRTAGFAFFKRQSKNVLLRNAVNNQVRETSEAEPFVVARISHKHAAFCAQCF